MSAWESVLSVLVGLAGTIILNLIAVSWYLGRHTAKYDAYGERIADLDDKTTALEGRQGVIVDIARDSARDIVWLKAEVRRMGGIAPNGH
jgi:hypothetical protein